ncbi:MAG TPA: polysaccharide deacetylase family protein [Acidimicrobiales bacterium]|nr:polysaccharide deacetylase family protein [Acidimicrobiales bacterium]
MTSLAEALGHPPGARLLIITCDDLGVSHAINSAVYDALRTGVATSAGLVVPGPWAREAAASYRGEDVGTHLTLNAEYDLYRWGPVTHAPSLLDGDGGFPRTLVDLWEHADMDEVRKECRAQVERAVYWGFDVSHLSAHLGALELRPEFFDVALALAVDFGLPLRLPGLDHHRQAGFPFRQLAAEEGVLAPDRLVRPPRGHSARLALDQVLADLPPGVTEVVLRPARDSEELRAVTPDWPARVEDYDISTAKGYLQTLAGRTGLSLTSYRALRDLQRRQGPGRS